MEKLYYYTLCPFSRKVRFVLNTLGIEFVMIEEKFWERRDSFLKTNPAGTVPVLIRENGAILVNSTTIVDFFIMKSNNADNSLLPNIFNQSNNESDDILYSEIKKICTWFDEKFAIEVVKPLLYEKIINFFKSKNVPNPNYLSVARYNFGIHAEYLEYLLSNNTYLCCDQFTLADLTVACHLSVMDYLGEIIWSKIPKTKQWYSVVKSKLEFREFLKERISGFPPPKHYEDLDF